MHSSANTTDSTEKLKLSTISLTEIQDMEIFYENAGAAASGKATQPSVMIPFAQSNTGNFVMKCLIAQSYQASLNQETVKGFVEDASSHFVQRVPLPQLQSS